MSQPTIRSTLRRVGARWRTAAVRSGGSASAARTRARMPATSMNRSSATSMTTIRSGQPRRVGECVGEGAGGQVVDGAADAQAAGRERGHDAQPPVVVQRVDAHHARVQGDEAGDVRLVEEALVVLADRGEVVGAGDGRGDPGLVFVQAPDRQSGSAQLISPVRRRPWKPAVAGVADRVPDAVDEHVGVEVGRPRPGGPPAGRGPSRGRRRRRAGRATRRWRRARSCRSSRAPARRGSGRRRCRRTPPRAARDRSRTAGTGDRPGGRARCAWSRRCR